MSKEGIVVDPDNIAIILTFPIPEHITNVEGFLGLISYYQRFIYFYIEIAEPLIHLTKQIIAPVIWTKECTKAFNKLKKRLNQALGIRPRDWTKDFNVYVDAFNFAIDNVLNQKTSKMTIFVILRRNDHFETFVLSFYQLF